MSPLVSIVIACYNYGRFLSQAIESALKQTYPNIEVIVVDDGSTDDTPKVALSYSPPIKYLYQRNAGVARTLNRGWQFCTGEFVNVLSADDWLETNKIEIQVQRFQNNPSLDLVTCGWFNTDEEGGLQGTNIPKWGTNALDHLLNNNSFAAHGALIRRSALERVGGFCEEKISESWTEDTDLWIRLAGTGSRFFMEPQALCSWRHHRNIISRSENIEPSYIGFGKMIDRLEAMNLPLVRRERWRRFRGLVHLAFCARFYARGNVDRARQIFRFAVEQFPDVMVAPRAFMELYSRAFDWNVKSIAFTPSQGLEQIDHRLFGEMLPKLTEGLKPSDSRKVYAAAYLALSDLAYGIKDGATRARALGRAWQNSPVACVSEQGRASFVRSLLGPWVVKTLAKLVRGGKEINR